MWLHPNYIWGGRVFSINVKGEGKICWICRIRAVDPAWRPGKDIPLELLDAKTQQYIKENPVYGPWKDE
jgi:hypothetical protein